MTTKQDQGLRFSKLERLVETTGVRHTGKLQIITRIYLEIPGKSENEKV